MPWCSHGRRGGPALPSSHFTSFTLLNSRSIPPPNEVLDIHQSIENTHFARIVGDASGRDICSRYIPNLRQSDLSGDIHRPASIGNAPIYNPNNCN